MASAEDVFICFSQLHILILLYSARLSFIYAPSIDFCLFKMTSSFRHHSMSTDNLREALDFSRLSSTPAVGSIVEDEGDSDLETVNDSYYTIHPDSLGVSMRTLLSRSRFGGEFIVTKSVIAADSQKMMVNSAPFPGTTDADETRYTGDPFIMHNIDVELNRVQKATGVYTDLLDRPIAVANDRLRNYRKETMDRSIQVSTDNQSSRFHVSGRIHQGNNLTTPCNFGATEIQEE